MKRYILLSTVASLALILAACGPQGVTPDASGSLNLVQEDSEEGMNFSPDTITLTAGQHVRIMVENHGMKNHEFMIGRNVMYTEAGAPNGFEVDFFEGIEDQVQVTLGESTSLMIDGETVMMGGMGEGSEEGMHDMEGMEEEGMMHMGWMLESPMGSGMTVIEFTVPEGRVGEWEMGCFEDDGAHYDDGMRGTVIVVAP
jgi:plastocyanin